MISRISSNDRYAMLELDKLLEKCGLRRDAMLDYSCGLYDGDGRLIATGSSFGNTLRCLASDPEQRGEGLMSTVVSELMRVQAERGNSHVFLYTKPENSELFSDLGFYEVAAGPADSRDSAVLMENRRSGFKTWLKSLADETPSDIPKDRIAAVVMNANPFTLGHRYLVERAASENSLVHLFVLSEDVSAFPLSARREMVRRGVLDLPNVVCHDSGSYMISSATFPSYFFSDDEYAVRAQARLDLAVFARVAQALGIGRRYVGSEPLSSTTKIYNEIMASELSGHGIECILVPRLEIGGRPVSASFVRAALSGGDTDAAFEMLPRSTREVICSEQCVELMDGPGTRKETKSV